MRAVTASLLIPSKLAQPRPSPGTPAGEKSPGAQCAPGLTLWRVGTRGRECNPRHGRPSGG